MKVDQVRDSVNCRVDEVRYFVKIVDVVRVDQVRVDQVGCSLFDHIQRSTVFFKDFSCKPSQESPSWRTTPSVTSRFSPYT